MIVTATFDSRDLSPTLSCDCYQKYTAEDSDYNMVQYYNEAHNTNLTVDDFDWSYDCDAIVRQIAEAVAEGIELQYCAIKKATVKESGSPQFYNYTTDWAIYEITYDENMVRQYVDDHEDEFSGYVHESGWQATIDRQTRDNARLDALRTAELSFYLQQYEESVTMCVMEHEYEIYEDNTKMELIKGE